MMTAGCGDAAPSVGTLVWGPAPPEMGLWGPELELEDDLRLMKAISTVGSGLQLKNRNLEVQSRL